MPLMISEKSIVIEAGGRSFVMAARKPVELEGLQHAQALILGCKPVKPETTKPVLTAVEDSGSGDNKDVATVRKAIEDIIDRNDEQDFTREKYPKVSAVKAVCGLEPPAAIIAKIHDELTTAD